MKVLITGVAGFIGYSLAKKLLQYNFEVVGIDNLNNYYNVQLKLSRLEALGLIKSEIQELLHPSQNLKFKNFTFHKVDISDLENFGLIFAENKFDKVIHLAAQAGVRNSIENPNDYTKSNLVGFANLLELVRNNNINHLIYASSSSVYGQSDDIPFSVEKRVDKPISYYAATKKANELMAYSYSHLYKFATTGLRFFTVYGPWGRPDMAYYIFTDSIKKGLPIKVYNDGNMFRDFTYISDIVDGMLNVINQDISKIDKYKIYNIGNNKVERLSDMIKIIEKLLNKKAIKNYLPLQKGDVLKTHANINTLINDFNYSPSTKLEEGLKEFIKWYKKFNF